MFETSPSAQIRMWSEFGDDALRWRHVTYRGLNSWFYVTETVLTGGVVLRERMLMISQLEEFLSVLCSPLAGTKLGKVFLVTPVEREPGQARDWEMHPLVSILEYRTNDGEPPRYVLETVSTYVVTAPADGIWEKGRGREVYRTDLTVRERLDDECLIRYERVMDFAVMLFGGDYGAAKAWVKTPLSSLDGLSPHDMLGDEQFERLQVIVKRERK